jgi:hypothetical protein
MSKILLLLLLFFAITLSFGIGKEYPVMWIHFTTLVDGSKIYIADPKLETEVNGEERLYYYYKKEQEKPRNLVKKMLNQQEYYTKVVGYLSVNCGAPNTIYIHDIKRYDQNSELEKSAENTDEVYPVETNIQHDTVHELMVEQLCGIIKVVDEISIEEGDKSEMNRQFIENFLREKVSGTKKESQPPFERGPLIKDTISDY